MFSLAASALFTPLYQKVSCLLALVAQCGGETASQLESRLVTVQASAQGCLSGALSNDNEERLVCRRKVLNTVGEAVTCIGSTGEIGFVSSYLLGCVAGLKSDALLSTPQISKFEIIVDFGPASPTCICLSQE